MISGKVLDDVTKEPLVGVNILVEGTTIGVMTDIDGNYTIGLDGKSGKLVFSYIGYETQTIAANREILNVGMKEEAIALNEVVTIGYSKMKRKDLTGSTVTLSPEKITKMPASSLANSLVGVAGIRVSGGEIRVRGNRSVRASNDPLIILDGMPYKGSLESIDQNDIASIDVLKDASSTSLYGSQGANGVIIITSKQGKKNEMVVTFDGYAGIGIYVPENYRIQNAEEYVKFKREAYRAAGTWKSPADDPKVFTQKEIDGFGQVDYNWFDDFMKKNGFWTNNTIALFSGTEKTQYKVSLNYVYNDVRGRHTGNNNKYNLSFDLVQSIGNRLKFGLNGKANYQNGYSKPDMAGQLLYMQPTVTPFDEYGNLLAYPTSDFGGRKNPYLNMNDDAYDSKSQNWEGMIRSYFDYAVNDDLSIRLNGSLDQHFRDNGLYEDNTSAAYIQSSNHAAYSQGRNINMMFNSIVNYKKNWGIHAIDAFAVFEAQNIKSFSSSMEANGQEMAYYKWYNMGRLSENKALGTSFSRTSMLSFVGRLQYSLKDRYLATISIRNDGASQLAKGNKWDTFPSLALAWRASEEAFMKDLTWLSSLKLRTSYGVTGNHAISAYATLGSVYPQFVSFMGLAGEVPYPTMEPSVAPAPNLKWEKTKQFNLGVDFAVLDNRISGTFDYYNSKTHDLLNQRRLPYTSGFNVAWENIGKTKNKGYELSLFTTPIQNKEFQWNLDYNFYKNVEELVELYDPKITKDIQNGWWLGYPVNGVVYDYEFAGIWQTEEADVAGIYGQKPGEVKVVDQNGDKKIDEKDRLILGTNRPDFTMSLSSTIKWQQFDFAFDIYGEFGALAHDGLSTWQWGGDPGRYNVPVVDYWTPENPSNTNPRPVVGQSMKYLGTIGYHSNNYISFRYITLGYTFTKQQLRNKLGKLRLYCTVNEPFKYWEYKRQGGLTNRELILNWGLNITL
ncbi:MAG: SusC/RagA family TonB-linked outer membrane protein [Tannerellaceae bacterium]